MINTRTLVIPTYSGDKWKFEMLCRSMQAFLDPCKVVIIYDTNSEEVISDFNILIEELLEKFSVETHRGIDVSHVTSAFYFKQDGWVRQQVLKLLASFLVDTPEYVILDSKNFFLTKCSLDDIDRPVANKTTSTHFGGRKKIVQNFIEHVCKFLNYNPHNLHELPTRGSLTPYIIRTHVCRKLIEEWPSKNVFFEWLVAAHNDPNLWISEFLTYEIYEKKLSIKDTGKHLDYASCTIWDGEVNHYKTPKKIAEYIKREKDKEILVSGFHRKVDPLLSLNDINEILKICDLEVIMPQIIKIEIN